MKKQHLLKISVLLAGAVLLCGFARNRGNTVAAAPKAVASLTEEGCVAVGGTIISNFGAIDANTTLGPATGDLRGAVSGTILGTPQPGPGNSVVFRVQHHWVTESGYTLTFDPAIATTVPLSPTLFAIVSYPVHLTGGTGKFSGATGDLTAIGEVDLTKGTVFRYSGQLCHPE